MNDPASPARLMFRPSPDPGWMLLFVFACALISGLAACQMQTDLSQADVALPASAKIEAAAVADQQEAPAASVKISGELTASISEDVIAERYIPPKKGTIFTWRNNWTSLPPVISYRADGVVKFGSTEYVKLTSVGGLKETMHAYYDTSNFNLKGYRDGSDKAIVTYKPIEERYHFPLKAGARWVTSWESMDHRQKKSSKGGGIVQVIGTEELSLPAGHIRAVKVRLPLPPDMGNMRHHIWFSPELGVTVQEEITNGRLTWFQRLESVEKPG